MKKLLIPLCLALSSCADLSALHNTALQNTGSLVSSVCSTGQRTLVDEKVVYAAQVLYNIPARAYVTADKNHNLTPAKKAMIKPVLIKLDDLRRAIKAAKGTVNCDFSQMQELQAYVLKLMAD